jgi:hypothetical protein
MVTITIQNGNTPDTQYIWQLHIQEDVSNLREIIRSYIYQGVSEYNALKRRDLIGLVLSDPLISEPMQLDWEEQYQQALQSFGKRHYLVLVDGYQITDLDKSLQITRATKIQFFLLAPLVSQPICMLIKLTD